MDWRLLVGVYILIGAIIFIFFRGGRIEKILINPDIYLVDVVSSFFILILWPVALLFSLVMLISHSTTKNALTRETIEIGREVGNSYLTMTTAEVIAEFKCLICGEQSKAGQEVVICPSCEAPHHKDCFDYLGRCARYGCVSGRRTA